MSDLQKNVALNVIRRIHNEQSTEGSVESKLKAMMGIVFDETKAMFVSLYIKADDVSFEQISFLGDSDISKSIRLGDGLIGKVGQDNQTSFVLSKKEFQIALPIKRWSKTIGVFHLVFEAPHQYSQEEADEFETICMFLSEYISSEDVSIYLKKIIKSRGIVSKDKLKGTVINSGYALGNAVVHRRRKAVEEIFAKDKDKELQKLEEARQKMNEDLDAKFNKEELKSSEHVEILDAYRMIANDKGWYKRITNHINLGLTAEAAVEQAYTEMWNRLSGATDSYLKERLHDLRDIADRLRLYLSGQDCNGDTASSYKDIVIIVRNKFLANKYLENKNSLELLFSKLTKGELK